MISGLAAVGVATPSRACHSRLSRCRVMSARAVLPLLSCPSSRISFSLVSAPLSLCRLRRHLSLLTVFVSVSHLSLILCCWQIDYAMVLTTTAFLASAFGNIIVNFWVRKYRKTWFVVFILALTIILSGLLLGYMGFYRTLRAALQVPLTYISSITCKSSVSSKSTAPNPLVFVFYRRCVCVCVWCIIVVFCESEYGSWEACG